MQILYNCGAITSFKNCCGSHFHRLFIRIHMWRSLIVFSSFICLSTFRGTHVDLNGDWLIGSTLLKLLFDLPGRRN